MIGHVAPQALEEYMGEAFANALSWIVGLSSFWSAFFATIFGALAAFELERRHRRRERIGRECAKANALIATLDRMRYVLDKLSAAIPSLQDGKPTPESRERIAAIPLNLPSIDFRDLDFLLETNNPNDPCAKAYGRVALVQAKFDSVLSKLCERNDLARQYQANRGASILGRGEEFLTKIVQTDEVVWQLNFYAHELVTATPAVAALIRQVVPEVRHALAVRYPGKQFLDPFPEDPKPPQP